jgi:PIN domain nuclease of toxin-antitoxin system
MRYYLDTNILIFVLGKEKDELSRDVLNILEDYSNIFYLSSVSIQEMILLYKSGKLEYLKYKTYKNMFEAIDELGYEIRPVTLQHLYAYAELEPEAGHKDPSDHIIIAQSIADRIPVISSDNKFKLYERQGLSLVFNRR